MKRLKLIKAPPVEVTMMRRIRNRSLAEDYEAVKDNYRSTNFWDPELLAPRSKELINVKCPKDHYYACTVSHLTLAIDRGALSDGCPVCSGRIPPVEESLALTFPELAAEWLTLRNNDMDPREVHPDWRFLAYWHCPKFHTFRTQVSARTASVNPQGCPCCYQGPRINLSEITQTLVQFDSAYLNYGFDACALPEHYLVYWHCIRANHQLYESAAQLQVQGWQCSICLMENIGQYLIDHPQLMAELVSIEGKVKNLACIRSGSHLLAKWLCAAGVDHEWIAPIYKRALRHDGCPFCENRRPSVTNYLANFPDVAAELHPVKNKNLTPNTVVAGSRRKLWWKCSKCGHEWPKAVFLRTEHGSQCPQCKSNRRQRRLESRVAREGGASLTVAPEADHMMQTT